MSWVVERASEDWKELHPARFLFRDQAHPATSRKNRVVVSCTRHYLYISSGTWSLMGIELPEPRLDAAALRHNFTNEGGVGHTFRFLKNIMGLWLVQESRRTSERRGRSYFYAELTAMADFRRLCKGD